MGFGGVLVESGGGLGAEVAVLDIEVKGADAVRAADAGELHASLDPLRGVVPHGPIVVASEQKLAHGGCVAKVMRGGRWTFFNSGPDTSGPPGQPRRLSLREHTHFGRSSKAG